MKKNIKPLIVIGIILVALVIVMIVTKSSKRIPENDPYLVGNTAGNLNNGGYFAFNSYDNRVYFSNPYDHGYIYSMTEDETDIKPFLACASSKILCAGDYVYYYMDTSSGGTGLGYVIRTTGINRSQISGNNSKCLDRDACIDMQLIGNSIYYVKYDENKVPKTFKTDLDGDSKLVVSDTVINPNSVDNGTIYFNGTGKDHYLYALNTLSNNAYTVYQGNLWYPQYVNGYVYYMDVSSNYRLCRIEMGSGSVEVLTNDRVETFNVGNNVIFYQKSDSEHPSLIRMNLDGSNPEVILEGNYTAINLTGRYAYFKAFGDDYNLYHVPLTGSNNVSLFEGAKQAVDD